MKMFGSVLTLLGTFYRPKVSAFANPCSMFMAFQEPEILPALVWLLPTTLNTNIQQLKLAVSFRRFLLISESALLRGLGYRLVFTLSQKLTCN